MPKLWNDTIEAHRRAVRDAAIEATAALIAERGLRSVTMSRVAERTGIGRATLYRHFEDVEALLRSWHSREIARHTELVVAARDREQTATGKLRAVLETIAAIAHHSHRHRDAELVAMLHHDEHVRRAGQELDRLLRDVLADAARVGVARRDVAPRELAAYVRHALAAAGEVPSAAAVRRLVEVTMAGLRPPPEQPG